MLEKACDTTGVRGSPGRWGAGTPGTGLPRAGREREARGPGLGSNDMVCTRMIEGCGEWTNCGNRPYCALWISISE